MKRIVRAVLAKPITVRLTDRLKKEVKSVVQEAVRAETPPERERRRRTIWLLISLTVLLGLFTLLSVLVSESAYTVADLKITRFIQSIDAPAETLAMEALSWPGYAPQSLLIALAILYLLLFLGLRWETVALAFTVVVEELLNLFVKIVVHRPRPAAPLVHVVIALKSYSFPSGHVMFYTCFFGFLWFLAFMMLKHSKLRTILLTVFGFLIPAIGFSRIYLGEHWASDVLGAYILGFAALICCVQFYRWGKNRNLMPPKAVRGRK